MGSSPASGSVLTAGCLEPPSDSASPCLSLPCSHSVSLSLSPSLSKNEKTLKKNVKRKKETLLQDSKVGPLFWETVAHPSSWKGPFLEPFLPSLWTLNQHRGHSNAAVPFIVFIESRNTHAGTRFQADFLHHRKSSVTAADSNWVLSARWELREFKLIKIMAFDITVDRERVPVSGSKGNKQTWKHPDPFCRKENYTQGTEKIY